MHVEGQTAYDRRNRAKKGTLRFATKPGSHSGIKICLRIREKLMGQESAPLVPVYPQDWRSDYFRPYRSLFPLPVFIPALVPMDAGVWALAWNPHSKRAMFIPNASCSFQTR